CPGPPRQRRPGPCPPPGRRCRRAPAAVRGRQAVRPGRCGRSCGRAGGRRCAAWFSPSLTLLLSPPLKPGTSVAYLTSDRARWLARNGRGPAGGVGGVGRGEVVVAAGGGVAADRGGWAGGRAGSGVVAVCLFTRTRAPLAELALRVAPRAGADAAAQCA